MHVVVGYVWGRIFISLCHSYSCFSTQGDVYFYYGLSNFYQNHRRYVMSKDDAQLHGDATPLSSSCEPYRTNQEGKSYAPCGAIAMSLFNGEPDFYVLSFRLLDCYTLAIQFLCFVLHKSRLLIVMAGINSQRYFSVVFLKFLTCMVYCVFVPHDMFSILPIGFRDSYLYLLQKFHLFPVVSWFSLN